jgi:hypothetical protein
MILCLIEFMIDFMSDIMLKLMLDFVYARHMTMFMMDVIYHGPYRRFYDIIYDDRVCDRCYDRLG